MGKGTIVVRTKQGMEKYIHDVLYVPIIAHNLLSLGQLIEKGYFVVVQNNECVVYDKTDSNHIVAKVGMLQNRIFPLGLTYGETQALNAVLDNESWLSYISYRHLHFLGLKLLYQKKMVKGLPLIE